MKYIALVFSVLWTAVIFLFSSASGTESAGMSGSVTQTILDFINPILSPVTIEYELMHTIIRKSAHVFEYLVLGCSYAITFRLFKFPIWLLFLVGAVIAFADEASQFLSEQRGPSVLDALLYDIPGCFIGMYAALRIFKSYSHKTNVS